MPDDGSLVAAYEGWCGGGLGAGARPVRDVLDRFGDKSCCRSPWLPSPALDPCFDEQLHTIS